MATRALGGSDGKTLFEHPATIRLSQQTTALGLQTPLCAVFKLIELWDGQINAMVSMGSGARVILSCHVALHGQESRELHAQRPIKASSIFFCPKAVLPADKNEERSSTDLK